LLNDSDNFCSYYNQGLLIVSSPEGQTRVAMCCWQKRKNVNFVEFDSDYFTKLRNESTHKIPAACSVYCSKPGHIANERELAQYEPWYDRNNQVAIKKLHLKQGLTCNLTCISCSSELSSAWNKDYRKFVPDAPIVKLKKETQKQWQHLDLSSVEQVHFDGGEPLLGTDHIDLLKHLKNIGQIKNVTVNYNTNGTIWPSNEVIELWSEAKWVRLFFSLDGVGTTFEYTRYPAKWDQVVENMYKFQQLKGPCLLLEVNAIIGIHNIFNIPDFYQWWKDNYQISNQGDPTKIFVRAIEPSSYGGEVLDLKFLPAAIKPLAMKMLQTYTHVPGVKDLMLILNKYDDNSSSDVRWLSYFEKLDQLRGTNWQDSLSEEFKNLC
jgi:hypothetical protein